MIFTHSPRGGTVGLQIDFLYIFFSFTPLIVQRQPLCPLGGGVELGGVGWGGWLGMWLGADCTVDCGSCAEHALLFYMTLPLLAMGRVQENIKVWSLTTPR